MQRFVRNGLAECLECLRRRARVFWPVRMSLACGRIKADERQWNVAGRLHGWAELALESARVSGVQPGEVRSDDKAEKIGSYMCNHQGDNIRAHQIDGGQNRPGSRRGQGGSPSPERNVREEK